MTHDLWFALRRIRMRPLHSAVVALTLGLGIGAALAVFSIVDAVLVRPLPFPNARELVRITQRIPVTATNFPELPFSDVGYRTLARDTRTLSSAAAYNTRDANLIGRGAPRRLTLLRASASVFDALQVRPAIGRAFTAAEDIPNGPRVVVLSDWLWRSAFAADPAVIGTAANLDGEPFTIIGVLSPSTILDSRELGAWEPLQLDPSAVNPYSNNFSVIGRLAPNATVDQAVRDLTAIVRDVGKQYPGPHSGSALDIAGFQARVRWLGDEVVGDTRPIVALLLAGVTMLLVLTCANVANLQLAAAMSRSEELAVRAALGATRSRLIRGALIEGTVLAAIGAAVGLAIAATGSRLLATLMPAGIPIDTSLGGIRTVLLTGVIVLVSGAIVGALPVAIGARRDAALALRDRAGGSAVASTRTRRLLTSAQVALAALLLHGSGLLIASARAVQDVRLGFRPDSTISLRVNLPAEKLRDRTTRETLLRRILAESKQVPGVSAAAFVNALPLTPGRRDLAMALEGRPFKADGTDPLADYRVITSEYFNAMGITLKRGRVFTDDDANPRNTPIVISEGLAREIWGDDTDPVGHRLRFGPNAPWMPIIGVVSDATNRSVTETPRPELYTPGLGTYSFLAFQTEITLVVRAANATTLVPTLRRIITNIDPELALYEVVTLGDVVRDSRARMTTVTRLMSAYAITALLLAIAGTYAVLSYLVTQRRRELAVRVALGASTWEIMSLVGRESGIMVGAGVIMGMIGAVAMSRLLAGLLYGVTVLNAGVVVVVLAVASLAGVAAAVLPARRAALVDPCSALRSNG